MADDPSSKHTHFVSTDWLAAHLGDPDLQVVDGSWYLPAQARDAAAEFLEAHVPGAIFFDVDAMSDHTTTLPHMLPDAADFAASAGALGIASDKTTVVYDGAGLFSAPRVWWTLRVFGVTNVFILAGGFPKWQAEAHSVERGGSTARPATFTARHNAAAVASLDTVVEASTTGTAQIIDARPAPRFRGEAAEPRPGLRSGHMAGSVNVASSDLIQEGQLKSPEALRSILRQAGVDLDRPTIATCGSGVTAAVVVLALDLLGRDVILYDGSWAEYGAHPALPVVVGP